MLQILQSQNYDLQYLTTLEGSMCTQNHERRKWKTIQKPFHYILSHNPKVAAT
jgi:hypothetical protein